MKTTVWIPKDLFDKAQSFTFITKRSRSRLYSDALREYLGRHAPDQITRALNRVSRGQKSDDIDFVSRAAVRILENTKW